MPWTLKTDLQISHKAILDDQLFLPPRERLEVRNKSFHKLKHSRPRRLISYIRQTPPMQPGARSERRNESLILQRRMPFFPEILREVIRPLRVDHLHIDITHPTETRQLLETAQFVRIKTFIPDAMNMQPVAVVMLCRFRPWMHLVSSQARPAHPKFTAKHSEQSIPTGASLIDFEPLNKSERPKIQEPPSTGERLSRPRKGQFALHCGPPAAIAGAAGRCGLPQGSGSFPSARSFSKHGSQSSVPSTLKNSFLSQDLHSEHCIFGRRLGFGAFAGSLQGTVLCLIDARYTAGFSIRKP